MSPGDTIELSWGGTAWRAEVVACRRIGGWWRAEQVVFVGRPRQSDLWPMHHDQWPSRRRSRCAHGDYVVMPNKPPSAGALPGSPVQTGKDAPRAKDLKAIHAMARELALTEDCYRAMVSRHSKGRTESSADLTAGERGALLDELRKLGAGKRRRGPAPAGRARADDPQSRLIRALWLGLHALGAVRDPSERAICAFAQIRCGAGAEALQWMSAAEKRQTIEQLKQWAGREGWRVGPDPMASRWALLAAIEARLARLGHPARAAALGAVTARQLDQAIATLGEQLRQARAAVPAETAGDSAP